MKETLNWEILEELKETFGDRLKIGEGPDEAAYVMPMNVEEVQVLAEASQRYSVPLIPLGAGTTADTTEKAGLQMRFDLMRHTRLSEGGEFGIEAESGTVWLEIEDELRDRGLGLAVYPTSAPRATVGGWMATDGLGVGSFEYGSSRKNVLSANVVLPGGELREVSGEDLQGYVQPGETNTVVVNATLRTRAADNDIPFAIAFEDPDALLGAVEDASEGGVPFWHLAFLNPEMARARSLGDSYLLFGAYPGERSEKVEEGVRRMSENYEGNALPTAETHRVWTERFFPVSPAHPAPDAERKLVEVSQLSGLLAEDSTNKKLMLQCTVDSSKKAQLLTFENA